MAWKFPDARTCPACGYQKRTLAVLCRGNQYRLSCGWCANLSDPMEAQEAFFEAWGAPSYITGAVIELVGVPAWSGGRFVESVPIRVLLGSASALVMEIRDAA
jgi:hypothetical protein